MISKRDRTNYDKIADLFSENNNRLKLREYMNSAKLPVIPYLGNWLFYVYCFKCLDDKSLDYSSIETMTI